MKPILQHRSAFTLVELLVVISIIAVMMGLILPAVQKVRSAATRLRCAENMRQVGTGAYAFHNDKGQLPQAVLMPYACSGSQVTTGDARAPFGPNWAILILPYIEQDILYKEANITSYPGPDYEPPKQPCNDISAIPTYASYERGMGWRVIRDRVIKTYLCPADIGNEKPFVSSRTPGEPKEPGWARGNYAASAGPEKFEDSMPANNHSGGSPNGKGGRGPMSANFGIKLAALTAQDGVSNTILFNEVRIGLDQRDRRGVWAMGQAGSSITAGNAVDENTTPNNFHSKADEIQGCIEFWAEYGGDHPVNGIGPVYQMGCIPTPPTTARLAGIGVNVGDWSRKGQARSQHTAGVNACFADGSVRFIHNTVSRNAWYYMLSRNDGGPVTYKFD